MRHLGNVAHSSLPLIRYKILHNILLLQVSLIELLRALDGPLDGVLRLRVVDIVLRGNDGPEPGRVGFGLVLRVLPPFGFDDL